MLNSCLILRAHLVLHNHLADSKRDIFSVIVST